MASGTKAAIIIGSIVGGLFLIFLLVAGIGALFADIEAGPPARPSHFTVTSAVVESSGTPCGNQTLPCHTFTILVDNSNGTYDFDLSCCWSAITGDGAGYDVPTDPAAPDWIAAGSKTSIVLHVSLEKAGERIATISYDRGYRGYYGTETATVPTY